jgi:ribonuclease BN (tRNA processing enzyme)
VELHVLGAGPSYTNQPGALGAAYLVRADDEALLLDLGQGSFAALAATFAPSRLLGVVISHLHPDHFVDLVPLRHYLRYEFEPRRRLTVFAPDGLESRLDALFGSAGFAAEALDFEPLVAGSRRIGSFVVEARRVTHTDDSHALRVTGSDGMALVYSGDCGFADDLAPLIQPGDTLLSEISFGAGPVPVGALHLDGSAIAALVRSRRPGRVLLTHLQMGFDRAAAIEAARDGYVGDVRLVAPGDRFVLG